MNVALVTLSVPPFTYRSFWWWSLDHEDVDVPGHVDIVGPSGEHHFQKQSLEHGTAHLLNIYAEEGEDWTERERNEFVVKSHVYLSKLASSGGIDRILIADTDGAEPMLTGVLSTLGSIHVIPPQAMNSRRGELAYGLMDCAERSVGLDRPEDAWPPDPDHASDLIGQLFTGD